MDGVLTPSDDDLLMFCRNPEQFGDGAAAYVLRTNRPTWWLLDDLPWMPRPKLEEVIQGAADGWSPFADVRASRAASQQSATWLFKPAAIDGPGSTLADAQLPNPSLMQQVCRIDVGEQALAEVLYLILMHEIGHLYGLQHFPVGPPPELMEPSLNRSLRGPQQTEAALMAKWFGQPVANTPTPGPTTPAGALVCTMRAEPSANSFSCTIDAQLGDKRASLKGTKLW